MCTPKMQANVQITIRLRRTVICTLRFVPVSSRQKDHRSGFHYDTDHIEADSQQN